MSEPRAQYHVGDRGPELIVPPRRGHWQALLGRFRRRLASWLRAWAQVLSPEPRWPTLEEVASQVILGMAESQARVVALLRSPGEGAVAAEPPSGPST